MQVKVLHNAPVEHSAVLLTCIKVPPGFETFVLSIFDWVLKTGFTVKFSKILSKTLSVCHRV